MLFTIANGAQGCKLGHSRLLLERLVSFELPNRQHIGLAPFQNEFIENLELLQQEGQFQAPLPRLLLSQGE